jgi:hypothetical protein
MSTITTTTLKCDTIGDDLTQIETMTVSCYRCDPDNPLCIPQMKCPDCHGTGQSPIRLAGIMKQLRDSRAELNRTGSSSDPGFLEY